MNIHIRGASNAGYTLCTNQGKSGANHESCIAYTQGIRVRFDSWFVNLQPPAVFARTIKGHESDLHWFVCDTFISIHCLCILEDLFWKFLNSSQLINNQLIGLCCSWWFADGCANHEFDKLMNSVQRVVHGDSQVAIYLREWCMNFRFVWIMHSV